MLTLVRSANLDDKNLVKTEQILLTKKWKFK